MKLREIQLMAILLLCIVMAFSSACSSANASEPAKERRAKFLNQDYNRVKDNPVRVRSAKQKTVTTVGYIGTDRVRMRSSTKGKTTTIKGYVNGKYVTLKSKED